MDPSKLTSPLSELTKHLTHIPIQDMEDWVHRPIEVRRHQVFKMGDKVARPMNSFLLYRSAYADRTKEWISKNNHQVVSQLAGKSWKLETVHIRKKYERLATVERNNHAKAHPGYKFAPKVKKQASQAGGRTAPSLSHLSPSGSSPALTHNLTHNHFMGSMDFDGRWKSHGSIPLSSVEGGLPTMTYLDSAWPMMSSDRPSPGTIQAAELPHDLQQPHNSQYLRDTHLEDARFSRVELQDLHYTTSPALVGLLGANHRLLQPQSSTLMEGVSTDSGMDLRLLGFPDYPSIPIAGGQVYSSPGNLIWQEIPTGSGDLPVTNALLAPRSITDHVSSTSCLMGEYEAWESDLELNMGAPSGSLGHWPNNKP